MLTVERMVAGLRQMDPTRRERILNALEADERAAWLEAIAEAEAAECQGGINDGKKRADQG